MSNPMKGVLVALALVVVVGLQLAALDGIPPDWPGLVVYLMVLAIPCGVYAGSLAGRLREDRFLQLAGFGLAVPGFLAFLTLLVHHRPLTDVAAALVGTAALPILAAAAALERWTRPADLVPHARPRVGGWRKPTAIELAAILTVTASAIIAAAIAVADRPSPEISWWSDLPRAVDLDAFHQVFVFTAGAALPIGILLGRLARTLVRGRLVVLGATAMLGVMWVGCLFATFTSLAFAGAYLLPAVAVPIVLERMTRAKPARDAQALGAGAMGMLIGAVNGLAISFGLLFVALQHHAGWSMEALLVPCVILVFAMPAGAMFGGLAGRVRRHRKAVLHGLAQLAVALLAMAFEVPIGREPSALGFYLWSCCTTAVGVWILERTTREHGSDPDSAGTGEALRDAEGAGGSVVRG